MSSPSRSELLSLLRSFLKAARGFPDYNIRQYTKRRTLDSFRQNQNLKDPSAVIAAFNDGKSMLELAKRQSIVYSLYAPDVKSIMEIKN